MGRAIYLVSLLVVVGCGHVVDQAGSDAASPGSTGSSCASSADCTTGDCVDGFCCASTCDQTCAACSNAKTGAPNGTCAPVALGQDPDDECIDDGATSCDRSGSCNGDAAAPACGLYPATTVCAADRCTAGMLISSTCSGGGSCEPAAASCAPYLACNSAGTACQASCTSDGACAAGNHCDRVNSVCTSVLRVAIPIAVGSRCRDANESLTAFANLLIARGHIATIVAPAELDTLAELQAYDVVIPTGVNCAGNSSAEAIATYGAYSPNISAYISGGGGLVAAGWVLFGTNLNAAGAIAAELPTIRSDAFTAGSPAMTVVAGHPITAGVAGFIAGDYSVEAGGTKPTATTLLTNPAGAAAGAAWPRGLGRTVYLAPPYFEPWSAYTNENLLDGSQPSSIALVIRAVEWAGHNL